MDYDKKLNLAKNIMSNIQGLYITGSIKRKEPEINDIDFITKKPTSLILMELGFYYGKSSLKILSYGKEYMRIKYISNEGNVDIDFWRANDDYEYKFLKWMRNMSKGENIYYRKLAKNKGLTLSDRGLRKGNLWINIPTLKVLKKALRKWDFDNYENNNDNENNINI